MKVTQPWDGADIEDIASDTQESLEEKLAVAFHLARDSAAWLSIPQRIDVLHQTQELMRKDSKALATLIAREGGKPLTDAEVEVARAIDGVGLCIDHIKADVGRRIPIGTNTMSEGRWALTDREPIGVVAAISAFNHPLNLIVHQVAPAIAAGCPALAKPSADTPLSCVRFVDYLHQAGLPEAFCQTVITEEVDLANRLATDERLGFLSFIGSAKVGWMLRSQLAPGVRCALEHGGAAPVLLCEDADFHKAVPALVKGGYYHAGQVCVSVQRIFVPRARTAEFVDAFSTAVDELTVGDPTRADTDVGPLIRPGEVTRVAQWVDEAVAAGAELITGGRALSDRAYAPTVLLDPPRAAKVSTQEVFGPVVCVYPYDDQAEAIAQANALDLAFQAAVFGENLDTTLAAARQLAASAVMINDHTAFRDDIMPFAGLRHSGLGVGGIPYTIEDMQIEKMIVLKSEAF